MELLSIGIPEMKIANLFEDVNVLKDVQVLSSNILREDPNLVKKENETLKKLIANKFKQKIEI